MKNLIIALALLLGSPAFAKHAPQQPPRHSKSVTYSQLRSTVLELANDLASVDGCEFQVKEQRDGVTLSVRDAKKTSAYLDVNSRSEISLEETQIEMDGSSNRLFTVQGEGSIRIVLADDAFESVELTDRDGRALSCELDL